MMQFLFILFSLCALVVPRLSAAADVPYEENLPVEIESKKYLPDLNVTEFILKNGMKVILKPTDFETNEVLIHIMAVGGFASLPVEKRASGELATQIAWESGLENMTSDQLSVLLYEHSIEFNARIQPFSRSIEGTTDTDGLPILLKIVKMFFMQQHFSLEAFNIVLKQNKEALSKKNLDRDTTYEDAFTRTNTQDYPYLMPLTKEALDKADFNEAHQFFDYSFGDPSQFVCVIVGDFNIKNVQKAVADTLGIIFKRKDSIPFNLSIYPKFPAGIMNKKVYISGRTDSLARITFPLNSSLTTEQLQAFQIAAQVLETRLRDSFRKKMNSSMGISVSYELPMFPLQNLAWLVVQYRCKPAMVQSLKEMILQELKLLRKDGPTASELEKVIIDRKREDEFWLKENSFWMASLTNSYLWGMNPNFNLKNFNSNTTFTQANIQKILSDYVSMDNYSIIYSNP